MRSSSEVVSLVLSESKGEQLQVKIEPLDLGDRANVKSVLACVGTVARLASQHVLALA